MISIEDLTYNCTVLKRWDASSVQDESLTMLDYELIPKRNALYRLSSAMLSNIFLIVVAIVLALVPKIGLLTQQTNSFTLILYSSNYELAFVLGLAAGLILPFFSWLILAALLAQYFGLSHVLFSMFFIYGVFFTLEIRRVSLALKVSHEIKKIMIYFSLISAFALCVSLYLNINLYLYLTYAGYFSKNILSFRSEYLATVLVVITLVHVALSLLWALFYARTNRFNQPRLNKYSLIHILTKLRLSSDFKTILFGFVQIAIEKNESVNSPERHTRLPTDVIQLKDTLRKIKV